jgi:hypothetical protein
MLPLVLLLPFTPSNLKYLLPGLIYYNLDNSLGALRSRLNVLFVQ